jgi:Gas vesicle protein G
MDLLTLLLRLPLLPVTGVVRLAGIIRDETERQWRDPATVRRELEAAQAAREAGRLSPEQQEQVEKEAVARLTGELPESTARGRPAGEEGS